MSPAPDSRTTDVELRIGITPPPAGFTDEDGLPDPAMRLHAMDVGLVSFEPSASGDRIVLRSVTFGLPLHLKVSGNVRWWQRWIEAKCIPQDIIYENVDRTQLQARLQAMPAPINALFVNRVPAHFGLGFPADVTRGNKAAFITEFLSGTVGRFLIAEPGAYLGVAAIDPGRSDGSRLLRLHVRYHDHTDINPQPMNPRELFYLLFGDDSAEATDHPLLQRMQQIGQSEQADKHPETRRMLLRPPLRTSYRVQWEADREIDSHSANWALVGALGVNRLFNTHRRGNRSFNQRAYNDLNKCNLFTSDICLRAGFRVCIHPVGANLWHYLDANTHATFVHRQAGNDDRVGLRGIVEDRDVTWAWKFENWLRAQVPADRMRLLNEAILEEGRCFLLAGARARKFRPHQNINGIKRVTNCAAALGEGRGIGHIVIVRAVLDQPQLAAAVGTGLQHVRILKAEASGSGARGESCLVTLGGMEGQPDSCTNFIRLHLLELHPGRDPDTVQGLRDLNVHNQNPNLLGLACERAPDKEITHLPNGQPAPAGQCCRDQYPGPPPIVFPGPPPLVVQCVPPPPPPAVPMPCPP